MARGAAVCRVGCDGSLSCRELFSGGYGPVISPGANLADAVLGRFSSGRAHGLLLRPDGSAATFDLSIPTTAPVAMGNVVSVTAGDSHFCVLVADGVVKCWGQNGQGQLGQPSAISSSDTPVVFSGPAAQEVVAGGMSTCIRDFTGKVLCRGSIVPVNLPPDTLTEFPSLSGASHLVSGGDEPWTTVCGVFADHVVCEGNAPGAFDFSTSELTVTPTFACGLDANGAVHCYGQVYNYDTMQWVDPSPVGAPPLVALASNATCGLTSTGHVVCWTAELKTPVDVGL